MQLSTIDKTYEKERQLIFALRKEKAAKGLEDLYFFSKYVLGYEGMEEQPHRDLCNFLMRPEKHKLDLEPRGSFKSTVGNVALCLWKMLKNPNIRILIDSQDLANSKKFLSEIKQHIENNQEFRNLYGDLIGPKWTDSEITISTRTKLNKVPTIITGGVETPRVGMHVDLLIEDDLHSEHNTQTAEQIDKVIKHWRLNSSILEPGGEEYVIGTRWKVGDLYGEIIDQEKQRRKSGLAPKFIVRRKKDYNQDGSLYFPTRLTADFLADQKIQLGSALYAGQYKNDPVDESATRFKKSWMKFYGYYPPKGLLITAVMDPAISERDVACDTAFTIVGTDEDGYMYILAADFLKDEANKVVDKIFHLNNLHNPNLFGIEVVAFQKTYKYWVWERMRQTGQSVNIVELKTDTSITKDMRIKGLEPFFESGSILWPGKSPKDFDENMLRLWDQVTMYPMSKYIDGVDSLAYHLQLYTPPAERKIRQGEMVENLSKVLMEERNRRVKDSKIQRAPVIGHHSVAPIQRSFYERVN